jgi:replicative DNA helicase
VQNKELEFNFLKHILTDPKCILKVQERGVDESFFDIPTVSKLFGITIRYYQAYSVLPTSADVELVLSSSKYTSNLGDDFKKQIAVLFSEVSILSNPPNFDLLLDELIQYHKTNLFQQSLFDATEALTNNSTEKAIEAVKKSLASIDKIFAANYDLNGSIEENAKPLWDQFLDAEAHPEKYRGINVGFDGFDKLTGGLVGGTVTLIIGGWKSAKSVLSLNMAHNVATTDLATKRIGKRVLYHVNEGRFELNQARLASCATGINYTRLSRALRGRYVFTQQERDLYEKYLKGDEFKELRHNLIIDSAPPIVSSARYISAKIKELKPEFVIIDYLGLLGTDQRVKDDNEKLGKVSSEVVGLAIEYNVPIILIAHVNRKAKQAADKNNEDYDSEDMGLSIEPIKNVDAVVSWRIEDPEQFKQTHKGIGTLAIRDARNVETGTCQLLVSTSEMKIKNIVYGGMGGMQP